MSQPLVLNKQQQQEFGQRMNEELDKVTMSWDNELRKWHALAIKALDYASPVALNITQKKFVELFAEEKTGLNMNIVMVLCNNIESRTPHEMGYDARDWADVLLLNQSIADAWNQLMLPVQKKILKEFEIMNGIKSGNKIIQMGEA